ncbi:MAG: class I SAM-dependent methyltransferase [Spirochaetes bacterium]|nr:class I SAM-dependent methyltransferase [Spirochaetota bacterium]
MLTVDFDRLGVRENDLVLDAGCGFGRHSLEYLRRGACVFSMDMDWESLLKTRYVLAELGLQTGRDSRGFVVHSGDALNLPFRDETFDRIICAEVMEHVSDDYRACSELTRVLKKNGRIAITVPTFFSEVIYDCLTFEYFATPGGHVRKYLPKTLVKIMRQNGLEIYGIGFKHAFHTIWWMIRCVVGLHNCDHPITRGYHRFLHLGLYSNLMRRLERFSNYFFPKSIVVYAWKR